MFNVADLQEAIQRKKENMKKRIEEELDWVLNELNNKFTNGEYDINECTNTVCFEIKKDLRITDKEINPVKDIIKSEEINPVKDIIKSKEEVADALTKMIGCESVDLIIDAFNDNKVPGIKSYVVLRIQMHVNPGNEE